MRNVLVRPHHYQGAFLTVNAAQGVDVLTVVSSCAKRLFIIMQPVAAFGWQQQSGHGSFRQCVMVLLGYGAHVYCAVNVCAWWREAYEARLR